MNDYIISTCSTADMPEEFYSEKNIKYVCFHFTIDGETYPDDLGKSIPFENFYNRISGGSTPITSQVNEQEYIDFFEPFLKAGQDIIHATLSSGISGTNNSANLAAIELREIFPERKIYIVDSLCASAGLGLFVDMLAEQRDLGMDIDSLNTWAEEHKYNVQHWFFTSDLTHLCRGGRISKTAFTFGKILSICPLLEVNNQGKLIPREKIRTKRKAMERASDKVLEIAKDGAEYSGRCYIGEAACYEDAKALRDIIVTKIPTLKDKIKINSIGTVIGSHTGPGTVAVFFEGCKREN